MDDKTSKACLLSLSTHLNSSCPFVVKLCLSTCYCLPSETQSVVSCVVAVNNQMDSVNISNGYNYKSQLTPVITEVSPRRGGTAGGTRLTITGSGFRCSKGRDFAVYRGHNGESHPDYEPLVKN